MRESRDLIRRLMLSVNVIDGVYAQQCKKIGIKENMLTLLYALDDGQPYSQKEISEKWLVPKTTLNTIVQECIQSGFVTLEEEVNKWEKLIRLTAAGQKYGQEVLKMVYETEERALEKTLASHSEAFIAIMETFTEHLQQETAAFIEGQ